MICPLCGAVAVQISSGMQAVRYKCTKYGARFSLDRSTSAVELARLAGTREDSREQAS
jgi:transposase-like protein